MLTLYVFSLILGVGLLAFSLLGGDADADATSIADVEALRWLSLRGLSYFAFVFGGVGAALTYTWHGITAPLIAGLAVGSGVVVSAIVNATFRYLKRTESGDRGSDDRFIGLTGRVVLPFGESGMGKVLVTRADRSFELLARPFDDEHGEPRSWQQIIVVEMQRGTALVTPYDAGSQDALPASPE
jgi:hypothetical protein